METEVRTLKRELARTQEALKAATKKCRDLVSELGDRTASHESEKTLRDQQLSRILRALLVLESRLKQEQKSIRQLLSEKDNVIRNQQLEIARLRRYTKNYIKCKRDQTLGQQSASSKTSLAGVIENGSSRKTPNVHQMETIDSRRVSGLSKDIEDLKCEIITKLNPVEVVPNLLEDLDRGVKKTHSFAGSDVSKASLTSSENTDASIITTTTDESPSFLSTEGFCEGESTDVSSPGSTLNKSTRYAPTMLTVDSENETTMIYNNDDDENEDAEKMEGDEDEEGDRTIVAEDESRPSKRRFAFCRTKLQRIEKFAESIEAIGIPRSDSKDDGMDCNFASEDEEKEREPIYANSCGEINSRNLRDAETAAPVIGTLSKTSEDYSNNNRNKKNNNNNLHAKIKNEEQNAEETSANWYSDPDEDRINDDVFRHSAYRPNTSNHNSVLECVNQILLRDMEEEESVLSMPRRFKHRGRIVRFHPARLSDIESVGSEMERKNSEEGTSPEAKREDEAVSSNDSNRVPNGNNFEAAVIEDEYGMRINESTAEKLGESSTESSLAKESKAIPIVIIEPALSCANSPSRGQQKTRGSPVDQGGPLVAPLKLERIEEKTCLQMSAKGLTIAKNLDYEDIESLPEMITSPPAPKTPPALPPKPQFRNNTLILKKIPSPSFLIDETRKKQQSLVEAATGAAGGAHERKIFGFVSSSPLRSSGATSSRGLNFEESSNAVLGKTGGNNDEGGNFWRNRFNNARSSFEARQAHQQTREQNDEQTRKVPRVTNIVRHFEEFKIGGENEEKERNKQKERHSEFEQDFDIRQNFEEFNLDECDLSDDPDRPEGDGSERLGSFAGLGQNEKTATTKESNNVPPSTSPPSESNSGYDRFLEATGLSNKSILTPSRLLSNHKSMLKPKDVKYKNKIKATAVMEKQHGAVPAGNSTTHVRHWTGPFV